MKGIQEEQVNIKDYSDSESTMQDFVQGFSLTGDYIKEVKDATFEIISKPNYKAESFDNKTEEKSKLQMEIKLADGCIVNYYPNRTAQKTIIAKRGFRLENWIGFRGEFFTERQKVGENIKDVIYIKG